jgi:redox-sensitive bicupin YhaK (pirin superfamily)
VSEQELDASSPVSALVHARSRDLGGFSVRRVLPSPRQRQVGPFVFLDHMGPVRFESGQGINVRPHPHINLATVTYLFEGEIQHRDSLGYHQPIQPGAVNLMIAGRGIAHSERTSDVLKASGQALHGLQLWLGLPESHEECEPSFQHYPAESIPGKELGGVDVRVVIGAAYGLTSPVAVPMETLYVSFALPAGTSIELPLGAERALYVVSGEVRCGNVQAQEGDMRVLQSEAQLRLEASTTARAVLLGGAPLGERHIWWNFVSSRPARIEQAKRDWQEKRFGVVTGDETEFIPLPEG